MFRDNRTSPASPTGRYLDETVEETRLVKDGGGEGGLGNKFLGKKPVGREMQSTGVRGIRGRGKTQLKYLPILGTLQMRFR